MYSLLVRVSGLTEKEMPEGEVSIHAKLPRRCVGGGGMNVNNQQVGQLLFLVRDIEDAKEERFEWYQ